MGHQFDGFQVNRVRLSRWGTSLYLRLQKMDLKGKPLARLIDRLNTRWLRMSPKVASGALAFAGQRGADRIFCGHTHEAIHVEKAGVHYYNSGGWVDSRLTYLTIDEQGFGSMIIQSVITQSMTSTNTATTIDKTDANELTIVIPAKERGQAAPALADVADESGLLEDVEYESIGG